MEFYSQIQDMDISSDELQQHLRIGNLKDQCASITDIIEDQGNRGRIYSIWGEFVINRELINGGVRFSLPGCPNNLCWVVTTDLPPVKEKVVIYLTVNRKQLDVDFEESIEIFVADMQQGIRQYFLELKEAVD